MQMQMHHTCTDDATLTIPTFMLDTLGKCQCERLIARVFGRVLVHLDLLLLQNSVGLVYPFAVRISCFAIAVVTTTCEIDIFHCFGTAAAATAATTRAAAAGLTAGLKVSF